MEHDDDTIDLLGYLSRLKRHWKPALAVALLVLAASALLGLRGDGTAATHEAKAHVAVVPNKVANASEADLQVQLLPQIMRTFVALEDVPAFTDAVSKEMAGRFTPEQVAESTSVYWGGGSLLLAVNAEAPEEQDALDLANAGAKVLAARSGEIVKMADGQMPGLYVAEQAKVAEPDTAITSSGSKWSGLVMGVPAGLVAGLLTAFVLEWLAASRARRRRAVAPTGPADGR